MNFHTCFFLPAQLQKLVADHSCRHKQSCAELTPVERPQQHIQNDAAAKLAA